MGVGNVLETSSWDPAVQNFSALCQLRNQGSHCLAGVKGEQTDECGDVLFYKVDASGTQASCPVRFCFQRSFGKSAKLHFSIYKKSSIYLPIYLKDIFWEITNKFPTMPFSNEMW